MSYFEKYPKVVTTQKDGTRSVMVNLMTRSSIIQTLLDNPLLFYTYDVQDGETPEMTKLYMSSKKDSSVKSSVTSNSPVDANILNSSTLALCG